MTHGVAVFIAVCVCVIAVETTAVLGALVFLALRVSKTVQSIEELVERVEERVASIKAGWMRVFQGAGHMFGGFVTARSRGKEQERERRLGLLSEIERSRQRERDRARAAVGRR